MRFIAEYRLSIIHLSSSLGNIRWEWGHFDNRGSRRRFDYTFDSMSIATNRIRARWFFDSNSHGPWEYWNHNVPAMNIIQVLRQYNPKSIERCRINLAPPNRFELDAQTGGWQRERERAIKFGQITTIRYSSFSLDRSFRFDGFLEILFNVVADNGEIQKWEKIIIWTNVKD